MKNKTAWTVLIYGLLLMLLGYIGYVQAASLVSLRLGLVFGALVIACSVAIFKNLFWGVYGALIFTFLLTATFAFRYSVTGKGVPGVLAVLSGGILLFLLTRIGHWKK